MTDFALHPQLKKDTFFIADLPLSSVLLMNNSLFPWVILVPRVQDTKEIIELSHEDRHRLMDEITLTSKALQSLFNPDKLNVGALGNMVPQLHVHVIARFTKDAAWPKPVWGKDSKPYEDPKPVIDKIQRLLGNAGALVPTSD